MKDVFEYDSHTNGMQDMIHGVPLMLKESDHAVLQDLETSIKLLNIPDSFAYLFGAYNNKSIDLLKKEGFKYAFTVTANRVKIGDNPYELGRIVIGPSTTINEFEKLVMEGSTKPSGWNKVSNNWYYYGPNVQRKIDWFESGDNWYYLNAEGVMKTGWVKVEKNCYYINENVEMKSGWLKSDNKWYYLDENGKMKTSWLHLSGDTYYLNSDGAMATGWGNIDGTWYDFFVYGKLKVKM